MNDQIKWGKKDFMKTDMTQGKPVKVLLGFTIPVFIGNVFQQFYNCYVCGINCSFHIYFKC